MKQKEYLHEFVYNDLKEKITKNIYPENSLLPKEIEMTNIYQVSRHTVRKAMDRLSQEGLVRKVKGTGTFVTGKKADYSLSNMTSFSEIVKSQGGNPNSIVLSTKLINVEERITTQLNLPVDSKVYVVERIRKSDDLNLCLEVTYISPKVCPNIDDHITTNASLYELYEKVYGLSLDEGVFKLEAINASKEVSKLLDIPAASSILYMEAVIHLTNNTPLYFVEAYYVGSRYIFTVNLKR